MYQRNITIGSLKHKLTVIDINQYLWCNVRSPFQVTYLRSHEQVFRNQSFGSSVDGIMHLLADTLRVLRINYRPQICLQLGRVTKPIGLRNVEITSAVSECIGLTLAMSTNLLTNES